MDTTIATMPAHRTLITQPCNDAVWMSRLPSFIADLAISHAAPRGREVAGVLSGKGYDSVTAGVGNDAFGDAVATPAARGTEPPPRREPR